MKRFNVQIAVIAGVPVIMHWSFVYFLLVLFTLTTISKGISAGLLLLLQVVFIFTIICIHEFCHILTAKRYGIKTESILLLPIGGAACMDKMPEKPWQEFLMAVAGPLSNICLALAGHVARLIVGTDILWISKSLDFFVTINIIIACFNILPIFPMDGGRVLRSLLQVVTGTKKHIATNIAYYTGVVIVALVLSFAISSKNFSLLLALGVMVVVGYAEMKDTRKEHKRNDVKDTINGYLDEYYYHTVKACHMVEFLSKLEKEKHLPVSKKCSFLYAIVYNKTKKPCAECALKCPCEFYEADMKGAIKYYEKASYLGQVSESMERMFVDAKKKSGISLT